MTRPVHQYDLEGNYIASFSSVTEAAKANNISTSQISKCINGGYNKTGNYMFKAIKKHMIKPHYKLVYLYDLQGNYIKSFNTIIELSKFIEVSENELILKLNSRHDNKKHKVLNYLISYTKGDKCSPWVNLQSYKVPGDKNKHYKTVDTV